VNANGKPPPEIELGEIEIVDLPDEAATAAFAEDVAACLSEGDVVTLSGGLGAGKTTFARALIRAIADDQRLEVPSPTFTLVQVYRAGRLGVSHVDLYRLTDPADLDEIGLTDAMREGAVVVEWPERAGDRLPVDRLDIALAIVGAGRRATVSGRGGLPARFAGSRKGRAFLGTAGWHGASRRHLHGDASARSYERIRSGERCAVLMNWPPGGQLPKDDPRARFRARDVKAFVAVDGGLRATGVSAPEIYAADVASGLLLMEDFGDDRIVVAGEPVAERYAAAVQMLGTIHDQPRPGVLPLPDGSTHSLRHLDADALAPEVAVFARSYVPYATRGVLAADASKGLIDIWTGLSARLAVADTSWVLFDVQSPNLFWLPEREGIARIGVIDFQDMFVGPAAYDVASLCQDARVTIAPRLEKDLWARYVDLRGARNRRFDVESFAEAYAICAALRAMKNLGVFARLIDQGKLRYLSHLPRMREYLERAFEHPVLSSLALWYEKHVSP
jgi:tRNA threonylcarbamoyl adenosine modification protein YjeE